jgi:hypothetical protein
MSNRKLVVPAFRSPLLIAVIVSLVCLSLLFARTHQAQATVQTQAAALSGQPGFANQRLFGNASGLTQTVAVGRLKKNTADSGTLAIVTGDNGGPNVIYLDDGTGNFTAAPQLFGPGSDPTTSVALADMNGDGATDIIVGNQGGQSAVYLNDGNNTFSQEAPNCDLTERVRCIGTTNDVTSLDAGDVNGDGNDDIVVGTGSGAVSLYINQAKSGQHGYFQADGATSIRPAPTDTNKATVVVMLANISGTGQLHKDLIAGITEKQSDSTSPTASIMFWKNSASDTAPFPSAASNMIPVDTGGIAGIAIGRNSSGLALVVGVGDGQSRVYNWQTDAFSTIANKFGGSSQATQAIATADVNHDGRFDIIAVDSQANQSAVYLQGSDGKFFIQTDNSDKCLNIAQVRCLHINPDAADVAAADLDGDTYADIVAVGLGWKSYLLNQGLNFRRGTLLGGPTDSFTNVAVADVAGEARPDIVAVRSGQSSLIYPGNDLRNLANPIDLGDGSADTLTNSLAIADVMGTSKLDMLIGRSGAARTIIDGDNHQIGSFGGISNTTSITAANLFGSTEPEIIMGVSGQQSLIYQKSGNTFAPKDSFGGSTSDTRAIAAAKINTDTQLDIIVGNYGQPSAVYFQQANPNQPFYTFEGNQLTCPSTDDAKYRCFVRSTDLTTALLATDIDKDGSNDIVVVNDGASAYIYKNIGNAFAEHAFGSPTDHATSVAVADVNSDGLPDIIVGVRDGWSKIYFQQADSSFYTGEVDCAAPQSMPPNVRCMGFAVGQARSVAAGDLDGDGVTDIVVADAGQSRVYFNSAGSFDAVRTLESRGTTRSIVAVDIDGKNGLDLIVGQRYGQSNAFLNDARGNFRARQQFGGNTDNTNSVAVVDLNGDGHPDIVAGNDGQQSAVYLQNPTNGAYEHSNEQANKCALEFVRCFGDSSDVTSSVAAADINGDGHPDIVAGNTGGVRLGTQVYLYDAQQGVLAQDPIQVGFALSPTIQLAVADFNADGKLDIAAGYRSGQSAIYLNSGADPNRFDTSAPNCANINQVRCFGSPDDAITNLAVGDLDGNGYVDLVVGSSKAGGQIYLNNGAGFGPPIPFTPAGFFTSLWSFRGLTLGDMDGDGALDIIAGTQSCHSFFFWFFRRSWCDNPTDTVYFNRKQVAPNPPTFEASAATSFSSNAFATAVLVAADANGDGALDIIEGRAWDQGHVYLSDGNGSFAASASTFQPPTPPAPTPAPLLHNTVIALGDINDDRKLDIVAVGPDGINTYRNFSISGGGFFAHQQQLDQRAQHVALGDIDNNGTLDLIAGDESSIQLYTGADGNFMLRAVSPTLTLAQGNVQSIATGDLDGNGWLDLVIGSSAQSQFYLNDGRGGFTQHNFGNSGENISSVALADINGDGALDIIAGGYYPTPNDGSVGDGGQPSKIFLNDGDGTFTKSTDFGNGREAINSVAVADINHDGRMDVIVGKQAQPSVVYLQQRGGTFFTDSIDCADPPAQVRCLGDLAENVVSIAAGDINGDKSVDVVLGVHGGQSRVYLNDGTGNFKAACLFGAGTAPTWSVTLGDVNHDGALDIVAGNDGLPGSIFLNNQSSGSVMFTSPLRARNGLANNPPRVLVERPIKPDAPFFASTAVISDSIIDIPFYLSDTERDPVREVTGTYSLDGGGTWQTAIFTNTGVPEQKLTDLATSSTLPGHPYIYHWDTFKSNFFGQSDNVIFRIEVSPGSEIGANSVAGPYQRPYIASQTLPFRARGTLVRVCCKDVVVAPAPVPPTGSNPVYLPLILSNKWAGALHSELPITSTSGAIVYRLRAPNVRNATVMQDAAGEILKTDQGGYLRGSSDIKLGDFLTALLPIHTDDTKHYTLYYTSERPRPEDPQQHGNVTRPGEQVLKVSPKNALVLFDMTISLEWDASADSEFRARLESDIRRTSELLYVWSNGQAALGQVKVYQNRIQWSEADIRVYSSNRVRPNADQGGISRGKEHEPANHSFVYSGGAVRIGATWNRFGETGGNLGEDWPRALAHELGHYLLYLEDSYLGVHNGQLVPVAHCDGPMSDPYHDDGLGGRFNNQRAWQQQTNCADTLPAQTTGRWDWATIVNFYPWLAEPPDQSGPSSLPLDITNVDILTTTSESLLAVPLFSLVDEATKAQRIADPSARAMLFHIDSLTNEPTQITDLGHPTRDQVLARGAHVGDRLCVYELGTVKDQGTAKGQPFTPHVGCITLEQNSQQIALKELKDWRPELIVSPILSNTIQLSIPIASTGLAAGVNLQARLFNTSSKNPTPVPPVLLTRGDKDYTGNLVTSSKDPALTGYIQVWADIGGQHYEIVTDYALGGRPALASSNAGDVSLRRHEAPSASADGQVLLYLDGQDLAVGDILSLQAATAIPRSAPTWFTVVGQPYRLTTTPNLNVTGRLSIAFNYLNRDVPSNQGQWLKIYYFDEAKATWTRLTTTLSTDPNQNIASAPAPGRGLYVLASSIEIPLHKGFNLVGYPVNEERDVRPALESIKDQYTDVFTYDPSAPGADKTGYVYFKPNLLDTDPANTLKKLKPNYGYWIKATQPTTLYLRGTSGTTLARTSGRAPFANIPLGMSTLPPPPVTYYGSVEAGPGFWPFVGMPVVARVDGQVCGQATTRAEAGRIVYSIHVHADSRVASGCGAAGRLITFQIGQSVMQTTARWDGDEPRELTLRP